jgi:hypothetical protein
MFHEFKELAIKLLKILLKILLKVILLKHYQEFDQTPETVSGV